MSVPARYVLREANVLDAGGGFTGPIDVRVEDGRVVEVGTSLRASDLASIDFSDLWLMPGVFDCHDHLAFSTVDMAAVLSTPITRWALESAQNARLTLEAGVTFVRDVGGADRGLRDSLAPRYAPGPRLQISVVLICQTGGGGGPRLAGGRPAASTPTPPPPPPPPPSPPPR